MERTLSARSCSIHRLELEMGRLIEIKAKIRHTQKRKKKKEICGKKRIAFAGRLRSNISYLTDYRY